MEVFYYIPSYSADDAVSCGLKLSEWHDTEQLIYGQKRKCLRTLINPRDDIVSYNDSSLVCIKIEVSDSYCVIAEKLYSMMSGKWPEFETRYQDSMISYDKYVFGMYRFPECLVFSTVIAEQVSILNKKKDIPLLYDKSEKLYLCNLMANFNENNELSQDYLMYSLLDVLSREGAYTHYKDPASGYAVFVSSKTDENIITAMPDTEKLAQEVQDGRVIFRRLDT